VHLPLLAVLIHTLTGSPVVALQAPAGTKAIVYIFTSTDCPISNRYAPEIQRIVRRFGPHGVLFRLVYPGRLEGDSAIREHVKAFSYEGLVEPMRDGGFALVKHVGATITPEVAVIADGVVAYRGRIDDRYVDIGTERAQPSSHDLADALAAVLAGRPVAHATTPAVGCFIADLAR
jgi:hypothetical protein